MDILADEILEKMKGELMPAIDVVDRLQRKGYYDSFELIGDRLKCNSNQRIYRLRTIEVEEIFEFEDELGLFNTICIYALKEQTDNLKGLLMIEMKGL